MELNDTQTASSADGTWIVIPVRESDYAPGVLLEMAERRLLNFIEERLAEIEREKGPEEVERVIQRIMAIKVSG